MLTLGSLSRVRMGTCHICLYLLVYGISAGRWERDAHCPRQISTLELLIDFTDGWNPQRGLADSDDRINAASYLRSNVWNGKVRKKKSKNQTSFPSKCQSTKMISYLIRLLICALGKCSIMLLLLFFSWAHDLRLCIGFNTGLLRYLKK